MTCSNNCAGDCAGLVQVAQSNRTGTIAKRHSPYVIDSTICATVPPIFVPLRHVGSFSLCATSAPLLEGHAGTMKPGPFCQGANA